MKLNYLLEICGLGEVLSELDPIHLNHFFSEIVDEALHEVNDAIVGSIGLFEAVHTWLRSILQFYPTKVQLPLQVFEPEDVPEETLVLGDGPFIEDQRKWEAALEIEGDVVDIPCVLLQEGFLWKVEPENLRF